MTAKGFGSYFRAKQIPRQLEKGFSLIEVMAAILLLSVTGLAIARSTIVSYRIMYREERNSAALQLALQKMEEYAIRSPVTLSSTDSLTEPLVVLGNMHFSRSSTVTVNADNSRTILVAVNSLDPKLGGAVTIEDTFSLWGTM